MGVTWVTWGSPTGGHTGGVRGHARVDSVDSVHCGEVEVPRGRVAVRCLPAQAPAVGLVQHVYEAAADRAGVLGTQLHHQVRPLAPP